MTAVEEFKNPICDEIRVIALAFPETSEGTSCVNRAFKALGKNFVFLGEKGTTVTLRLKLGDSVDEVASRAATDDRYEVGTGGWTKVVFDAADAPPIDDLRTWITESFLLLAPKKVSSQM